ncbi:MAG TPA: branched-chain amino acid transaminase [Candidatus Sulfotelmatobacter sp.]|nr:branched-chain amino acid transaminase [Candidatus Sulfotelmatobacter sp.]
MEYEDLVVYHRGGFQPYSQARIGLLTHALLYGTGCFEGMRAFWNAEHGELYVCEPSAHFRRFTANARLLLMELPPVAELNAIVTELCRRNGFREDVYLRPVAYKSEEALGVRLDGLADDFFIVAVPRVRLNDAGDGLNACVSSWRRLSDNAIPPRAKITGGYVNAAFAKTEARLNGFDEAIVLAGDGHVSECSTANLVMVRDGVAALPPATDDNLEGITRLQVRTILADGLGLQVRERQIDRTELYAADELLLCGTGMGIAGIRSVDHRPIGSGAVGPVCRALRAVYEDVVRGRDARFASEIVPVYAGAVRPMPTINATVPATSAMEASTSAGR